MERTKSKDVGRALIVGLKLLLICAIIAGIVAFVYNLTKEKYAENQAMEKASAIGTIFGFDDGEIPKTETVKGYDNVYLVYDLKNDLIGYCVEVVESSGYNGDITMMVGYDIVGKVCGVEIVSHSETPGLGAKILNEDFREQFCGIDGVIAYKQVDGVSGATYSSKAVTAGVNQATATLKKALASMGGAENE